MPSVPFPSCDSPYHTPRGRNFGSPPPPERPMRGINDYPFTPGGGGLDDNDCRFEREFDPRTKIGEGHFSVVFKARNTVDLCDYAVKRTKRIVAPGQQPNKRHIKEAFALAQVERGDPCPNIVRYYSSWFESGQLFIQMELCESSLRDHMGAMCLQRQDARFTADEMVEVIAQVANGLDCMHQLSFVHLDIKPDNILRGNSKHVNGRWKIGDLGLAEIALKTGYDDICEGDCRYLAREVLNGDLSRLTAADVFSLGIMAFELGTNPRELPGGGDEWHTLRAGILNAELLPSMPPALWELLQSMVKPHPEDRPTCAQILKHPSLKPPESDNVCPEEIARLQKELRDNTSQDSALDLLLKKLKVAEYKAAMWQKQVESLRRDIIQEAVAMRSTSRCETFECDQSLVDFAKEQLSHQEKVVPEAVSEDLSPPKHIMAKASTAPPEMVEAKDASDTKEKALMADDEDFDADAIEIRALRRPSLMRRATVW